MCFPLEPVFTRDKRRLPNFMDGPLAGLGRHRRGHRHEHRPCVPGRHLHLAAEVPEVDAVPADLSAAAPVKDIYITYEIRMLPP